LEASVNDTQTAIAELDKKISERFAAIEARLKDNTEFVRALFREHPELEARQWR
jgi:hypothetical protein